MTKDLSKNRFVFAGNRFFVLEEMLQKGLDVVAICAVKGSFLEKELKNRNLDFFQIENKKALVEFLSATDFDIFIANGLPYILPITLLKENTSKQFINIHPSYLPDLRGADPVPGAILHGRDSGATCHYMDDGIDTGAIIEQVKIEYSSQLDCSLLYQLSFAAEKEAFNRAYNVGFELKETQDVSGDNIYYTVKDTDKRISFSDDDQSIVRRIKAFNTRSQGARFLINGEEIIVKSCRVIEHPYLSHVYESCLNNEVVLIYEDRLLIKRGNAFLSLEQVSGNISTIKKGQVLE